MIVRLRLSLDSARDDNEMNVVLCGNGARLRLLLAAEASIFSPKNDRPYFSAFLIELK